MSDINTNLFGAIENLVSRQIESTPIDLTITASVAIIFNIGIGEYKVTYKGDTFSAFSLDPMTVYKKGDEVYVLVPKGDFSSKKIILGKAAFNDKVSYADRQGMSNQWRTRGPNWLSPEWYWRDNTGAFYNAARDGSIVVTKLGQEQTINHGPANWRDYIYYRKAANGIPVPLANEQTYTPLRQSKTRTTPVDTSNTAAGNIALTRIDGDLQLWGAQMDYVMVQANFETSFLSAHSSGEYGVLVECIVDNPKYGLTGYSAEPRYNLMSFRLSFGDFNGAPYSFGQKTPQQAVFPVPRDTIRGLVRVSVFQDDGWTTDIQPVSVNGSGVPDPLGKEISYDVPPLGQAIYVQDKNNVFVTDIAIYWQEPINLQNRLFWLKVDAIRGTSLYDTGTGQITNVPLRARLMYGGEDVTTRENCKFIWFRQKYSALRDVANQSETDEFGNTWAHYLPEGENGWAPVELMMKSPADDPIFGENAAYTFTDQVAVHDTLNIDIAAVPWKWKYLVVCYYNPQGGSLEEVMRSNHNDALIWETEYVQNLNSIHDFELPMAMIGENLSDIYLRVRNNKLSWEEGVPYDIHFPDTIDPTKDWWCRWWWAAGKSYEAMQDSVYPRFIKGKRRIDQYLLNEPITFKAQVYGKKNTASVADSANLWPNPPGTEPNMGLEYNEFEIANVERAIIPDNNALVHVEFVGQRVHHYNSDGSIRLSDSADRQYNIRAIITPRDESIVVFGIEWLAPDGTPLRELSPQEVIMGTGYTPDPQESMLHSMWMSDPDHQRVLHYKVEQKYDINKVEEKTNTFILRIRFLNQVVQDVPCVITYITADGNGAQGSEWVAQIWPTNATPTLDAMNVVSYTPWSKKVQTHPRPLVVNAAFTPSGNKVQNPNYKLFLRPFITRNGLDIETLPEHNKYSYKVYWDVRYPKVKPTGSPRALASNGSYFRFRSLTGRAPTDLGGKPIGETWPANTPWLQAYTNSADTENSSGTQIPTSAAIQVIWQDNQPTINGATMDQLNYSFIVKAQIDIFYNDGSGDKMVATLFSYHPIDVVFGTGLSLSNFVPSKIRHNWPKEVLYSSTGIAPKLSSDYLRFFYGENIDNATYPLPMSAYPHNLTPNIQDVTLDDLNDPMTWRLLPRAFYFFEGADNGALRTGFFPVPSGVPYIADYPLTGEWPAGQTSNPDFAPWLNAIFVHPIIYRLSQFGNDQINGWDGKSIDLNEENGTIFAPTIGAGYKDPFSNTFSGVIMGIDKSQLKQQYNNAFGGFSLEDMDKNPYMTGLFGYQGGVSSFGIMENGTAYFGRADRGGRIIIDGYNAQIYGGTGGNDMNAGASMDMHNRMRLSFIDFVEVAASVSPSELDNNASMYTDGITVNTQSLVIPYNFRYYFTKNANSNKLGFGNGNGYGTAAIEIGQYDGLGTELIRELDIATLRETSDYDTVKTLEIPGKRRFLVTYDGTLYAMNAFIKGNIVGSNIIATQFFNADASFAVTKNGNLGIGKTGADWNVEQVNSGYSSLWSQTVPSTTVHSISDYFPVGDRDMKEDFLAGHFNFYVSVEGEIVCNNIHIAGGSIDIGNFHVIGNSESGWDVGDVVSFGTMYLVGQKSVPGLGTNALEVWGDSYFRGRLTNLGPVYFGSSPDKILGGAGTPGSGSTVQSSFNSPFSVEGPFNAGIKSWPVFPVQAALWPLYFRSGDINVYDSNNSWVTFSGNSSSSAPSNYANNGYSPVFTWRVDQNFLDASNSVMPKNITWRVDQLGNWVDAIFFTNKDWVASTDTSALTFSSHGLQYQGWSQSGGNTGVWGFGIKNVAGSAPHLFIETLETIRISAGLREAIRGGGTPSAIRQVIIDSWPNNTDRNGALIVGTGYTGTGTSERIIGISAMVAFTGKTQGTGLATSGDNNIESFFMLNGLKETSADINDERGRRVDRVARHAPGFFWMKSVHLMIDGAATTGTGARGVATDQYNSTVRLNRTFDGNGIGSANSGMTVGSADNCVGIGAETIYVRAPVIGGTNPSIHIFQVNGSNCNNANTTEAYFTTTLLRLTANTELSLGVNHAGHTRPTIGMFFTRTDVTLIGYTEEHQFGIYARFA